MGGKPSQEKHTPELLLLQSGGMIDNYPIRLNHMQRAMLFDDLMTAKATLTWKDVVKEKKITFRACLEQKISVQKLYNMQPDLEEWIKNKKVTLEDCKDMEPWRPNPFYHFNCHIGDLVLQKQHLTARVLLNGGVKFDILWERYGLRPEIMTLLKYSPEDWIRLGITQEYMEQINEKQWIEIFQKLKRKEVIDAIHYMRTQTKDTF
jgi:hypothetical protein